MSDREIALETALRDILQRFSSSIAGGGEIPGDAEAMQKAQRALELPADKEPPKSKINHINHVKLVLEKTEIGRGDVFLNDQPLGGVTDVEIAVSVDEITKVKLTINSEIEVVKSSSNTSWRNTQKFNIYKTKCPSDYAEALQKTRKNEETK